MKRYSRSEIKQQIARLSARREPYLICASGLGLVGHYAEMGGADMAAIYSSAYWRLQGYETVISDCHIGNTNQMALDLAERQSTVIENIPVMAGIFCSENYWDWDEYFAKLKARGFSAVMNFPTYSMATGEWRMGAESAGVGLPMEIRTLERAANNDLFTLGVAFDGDDAAQIAESSKIDMLLLHMGLLKRDQSMPLSTMAEKMTQYIARVREINPSIPILFTGGSVKAPEDTAYIYEHTDVVGYFAGETIDAGAVLQPMIDVGIEFASCVTSSRKEP